MITKERGFTKEYTLFIKGIAVLILCWHHLYWHNVEVPIYMEHLKIMDLLVPLTKVCVALFTLLSGYGINESYKVSNNSYVRFVLKHIKKLLINYWWVYIPVFILSFWLHNGGTPIRIYGTGMKGIKNLLLDFLGLRAFIYSPTLNNTWWYIEAALILYICFPLLHFLMKKIPVVLLMICMSPVLLASLGVVPKVFITTDRELYYVFPFLIGILLSEKGFLNKFVVGVKNQQRKYIGYSAISVIICIFLRTSMNMITDVLSGCSIILFGTGIAALEWRGFKIIQLLGKHSMNIYLIHSMIYYYFTICKETLEKIPNYIVRYLFLVGCCLIISVIIEQFKKVIKKIIIKDRKEIVQ